MRRITRGNLDAVCRWQQLRCARLRAVWLLGGLLAMLLTCRFGGVADAATWASEKLVTEPYFNGQMLLREAGQENPELVLLLHGLGDEAGTTWESLLPELATHYHVVAPDLPGFGRSAKGNQLYTPEAYAAIVDWLVATLPDKPLTLVGHSLGGAVAMVYASRHSAELERLVLVDTVGTLHRLALSQYFVRQQLRLEVPFFADTLQSSLGKVAGLLLEKTSRIPLDSGLILASAELRERFLAGDPGRIAALALVETDFSLLLPRIRVPTWLLWGSQDQVAPLRIAKLLAWNLPQAQLVLLDGLGHTPMAENPAVFNTALLSRLVQSPQRPTPVASPTELAAGLCEGENGRVFSGHYSTLSIQGCRNVRLENLSARNIEIRNSEVTMESSRVHSLTEAPALLVSHSRLTLTGVDLQGPVGILTEQSRLDLAGVRFVDTPVAISATGNPSALLSSSSTKFIDDRIQSLQMNRSLAAGDRL